MNAFGISEELSRRELLEQIAQEERLIRIHQAELALLEEQRTARELTNHDEVEEEEDWLDTLDALQSDEGTTLESKPQDDPKIHRLLPLVGGVTFSSVSPAT